MDHIVATKLIRKMRDRHDNRPEDVQEIQRRVSDLFSKLDPEWVASINPDSMSSLRMLRDELHRLGADDAQ